MTDEAHVDSRKAKNYVRNKAYCIKVKTKFLESMQELFCCKWTLYV